MPRTPQSELKRNILNRKKQAFTPRQRKLVPVEEAPDIFPKTAKMKYLEFKYHCKIESVIFTGSLDDAVVFFHNEVDRTTISRWRKYAGEFVK